MIDLKRPETMTRLKEDVGDNSCLNVSKRNSLLSSLDITDAKELFIQLHQKALALGLNQTHIQSMPSIRRIKRAKKMETLTQCIKWTSFTSILVLSVFVSWNLNYPITSDQLARIWIRLRGDNPKSSQLEKEKCLIKVSNRVQDLSRPPIDCGFCVNVSDVARVGGISKNEFQERFAYTGRPVVVHDGAANWSALDVFSFAFFGAIYHMDSLALRHTERRCQFFPYKTEFRRLGDVFLMDEQRALMTTDSVPWYIGWSNCDATAGSQLRSHYSKPYFLPDDSESSKTDWIFMGSPGYGAHMHIDYVSLPSWQAQIRGQKQWTLRPPPECYGRCRHDLSVTVHPGEIIVLDTNKWYHSTLILGEDISITIGSEFD